MIAVQIAKGSGEWVMTADGHSGRKPGNDIVCAACSVLCTQLAEVLDQCGALAEYEAESGWARVVTRRPMEQMAECAWGCFETGMRMVAEQYPENITLCVRGADETGGKDDRMKDRKPRGS